MSQLIPQPAWVAEASCASTDPEIFYPETGGPTLAAKAVCNACPVINECLAWALVNNEQYGVWGGLSHNERHRIRMAS